MACWLARNTVAEMQRKSRKWSRSGIESSLTIIHSMDSATELKVAGLKRKLKGKAESK